MLDDLLSCCFVRPGKNCQICHGCFIRKITYKQVKIINLIIDFKLKKSANILLCVRMFVEGRYDYSLYSDTQ